MTPGEVVRSTDNGWRVALVAGLMAFLGLSSFRASGYLYVELINEFNVDRGTASWPVSVLGTVIDIGGVLSGPLTLYFSVSDVMMTGTVITSLGMVLSAFAPNIVWITITMGLIHGLGAGTITTMLQVTLSANYKTYRGTAHGIMYAGSTVSSFVIPYLLLYLRRNYSFRGTLLLFGGVLLHTIPISFFLKVPRKNGLEKPFKPQMAKRDGLHVSYKEVYDGMHSKCENFVVKKAPMLQVVSELLRLPTYYVIVISWLVMCYNVDVFTTTIVDFATDRGATKPDAVHLLSSFAVTDFLGRIFLPALADQQYLRRSTLVACNFFFMGMAIMILPDVSSYGSLMIATLAIAGFMGCAMTMYGVVMADYVGLERLPVSYGLAGALCGPLLFAKPFFVGYFRDNHGKYDDMYRLLAGLLLLISVLWFVVVCLEQPAIGSLEHEKSPHLPTTKEV